jgi:hypothetical protein
MNRGATVKGNYKRHWISSDAIGEANGIRTGLFFLPSDHKRLSVFRWQSNLTASSNPGSDNMLHSMTWRHFVCCWSPAATLRGLSQAKQDRDDAEYLCVAPTRRKQHEQGSHYRQPSDGSPLDRFSAVSTIRCRALGLVSTLLMPHLYRPVGPGQGREEVL